MGATVSLSKMGHSGSNDSITNFPITDGKLKRFTADLVNIPPTLQYKTTAPFGSDCYLFVLRGSGKLSGQNSTFKMPRESFAVVQEGVEVEVTNPNNELLQLVRVIAPPPGASGANLSGFTGGVQVFERDSVRQVEVPEQKKTRLYFVNKEAANSERAHAMIVLYKKDTVTPLHHHPDAESIFILLEGKLRFTVNGEDVTMVPGDAAFFPMNDKHGLRVADDSDHAGFLEFHVPAAFSVVKE